MHVEKRFQKRLENETLCFNDFIRPCYVGSVVTRYIQVLIHLNNQGDHLRLIFKYYLALLVKMSLISYLYDQE